MNRAQIYVLLLLVSSAVPAPAAGRPPIGTNLNGLSYWSTELPFLDSFKTASAWVSGTQDKWDDGRRLDLDERGWVKSLKPGQVANMALFHDTAKFSGALARHYVVEYEGAGSLEYAELAKLVERAEHRDIIEIELGAGNATLTLASTDPNDYLRNIRITPEGSKAKPGEIFNPLFLEQLKSYRALRFMIWMLGDSNNEIVARRWSARPTPQDARWTIKGPPVEIMVALANRVHADPWLTMPHAANDDYVRRFAQTVKKSLDPKLKVYLEYSNEVWNTEFPQTAYARKKGLALGLSKDPDEALLHFYAKRAVEMFSIWEQVLGKERLVRVLSFHSGAPESSEIALSFGETKSHVDALATAPYFGYEFSADAQASALTKKMSLDELMRELETSSLPKAKSEMLAQAAVARKYGLPMIAYEGGQSLVDMRPDSEHDPALDALFYAANRDPRMGALYSRYLNDWAEAGGGLFMHLLDCGNFEKAGNWGALEYLTQPRAEAPKFDALMRFIEGQAPKGSLP